MNSNTHRPPKSAERLLRWFLKPELQEEVLGDMQEKHQSYASGGTGWMARLRYWYQVLNYLRPFAIRNDLFRHLNPFFMLRHNLKISSRNLIRDKGYSFLNVCGLALGMTVAILISLWVWNELSYNSNHTHKDEIAQLMRISNGKEERSTSTSHPTAIGQLLRTNYDNYFQRVVMVRRAEERIISFGDRHFSQTGNFMQAEAPALFTIKMLAGSHAGLADINSVLLAQSLAEKLFGNTNPLGQTVTINGQAAVAVTGIYEDFPRNSKFSETTYIAPLDLYFKIDGSDPNTWKNYNMHVYAQITPNTNFDLASRAIKDELKNHMAEEDAVRKEPELFLHPMDKWHLYSEFSNGANVMSNQLKFVWINSLIGIFVLFLAGINFVNLSTARSERRAKEIGVRKSLGSTRTQLFYQFMSESLLIAIAAFIFAVGLIFVLLPWFNGLTDKDIALPFWNVWFWVFGIAFTLLTGLLAGSYPAFYLAAFKPANAFRGWTLPGKRTVAPRKVLIVFQFTISIILIIGTLIIYQHIEHAQNRPIGYSQDGLLMLPKRFQDLYGRYDVFRSELKASGAVLEVAHSDYPLTNSRGNNDGFSWKGKDPSFNPLFNTIHVNYEYGTTVDWELLAGRDFSRALRNDATAVVITESAQKIMNLSDPVGQQLSYGGDGYGANDFTIIGVVKDLVKDSPFQATMPAIMFLSDQELPWLFLRLNPELPIDKALARVGQVFKTLAPGTPFDFIFMDDEYQTKFRAELQLGQLASFFAILAIIISCLGVFGLATYFAERRAKEIGIRRILGATTLQLWSLLSRDFAVMVALSCLIAVPLAWYFLNAWLAGYEYRTAIHWWVFAIAILATLSITLCTVSYQAIRATMINPADALQSE